MDHFLRKASFSSGSKSIVRIIAIGAASAGLLYLNNNPDSTTVKLSIPTILREHLAFQGHPSFVSSDHWQFGKFPLFLSRVDPALAGDVAKGAPVAVGDGGKPSCGCLGRDFIANAAAKIAPAVVNLSVQQDLNGFTTVRSMCSGTIIDADGTILTCAHGVVDSQGRQLTTKGKIDVTLQDGRTFEGTVVNSDLHSDIAIVKIKSKTPLPTAKLGSSSKLRPGDWVIAMGTPLSLQNTVTAGIVRRVIRPWLGLKMLDLNELIISQLKERDSKFPDVEKGILVPMVTPGSPADRAGFHPGDVVIEFDGKPVQSIKEIVEIMDDRIGKPLNVVVKRANNEVVKLTVIPEEANPDM
ncbi:hypothetical protein ES319_D08G247600v1 [Gossypium barbadense]|uniref:PDZ domain-containing protein n=1 Tax=Gossypium barbadense TaxID=3634 RepID=A0A5J5QHZ4_GOSBA|nr:hypothetical protein ES319_D08G247600v1 [Gossypium barbadense]